MTLECVTCTFIIKDMAKNFFKILHQLTGSAKGKGLIELQQYNFFSLIAFLGFQMTWISSSAVRPNACLCRQDY